MVDLIKFNGYEPPAPTSYDVDFKSIDGAEEQTESGDTYIERIVSQKPVIKVGWKNLLEDDVTEILEQIKPTMINVTYWLGTSNTAQMTCSSPSLKLNHEIDIIRYYDLSFTLE